MTRDNPADVVLERLKAVLPGPVLRGLVRVRRRLRPDYRMAWPPGHYYSPIPSLSEVRARAAAIFATPRLVPGVDLREADQLALVEELAAYYGDQPLPETA